MSRLDEIRARLAAATPGPWTLFAAAAESEVMAVLKPGEPRERIVTMDADHYVVTLGVDECGDGDGPDRAVADATLIANAPADLAYLLGEVERLRAVLSSKAVYESLRREYHNPTLDIYTDDWQRFLAAFEECKDLQLAASISSSTTPIGNQQ